MSVLVHSDSGSSPRISRMPSPGASLIEISDSLNVTPPSTGSKAHSDGPSRSHLVNTPDLATATCTAAATLILVSSMQPIMHSKPYSAAMAAMQIALDMAPVFISLLLIIYAARYIVSTRVMRKIGQYDLRISDWSSDVCSSDLSLNVTPPSTGSKAHSDGPSRSTSVITPDLATATCTAAATLMLVSSMQPIMHSTPYSAAMSAMRIALEMPPVFISLMLMMSAARALIRSITCSGPNTLSSAMTGVCTRSVTYFRPSMSCALTGCSSSSSRTPASSSACIT